MVVVGNRTAGMCTMYNSDYEIVGRIDTYINQVERLFIVDNSEIPDATLITMIRERYLNVIYISNNGNVGVARALNVAVESAINENFRYLLMMDDDSVASESLVEELVRIAEDVSIGIVSPNTDASNASSKTVEVLTTITSGSILKLDAYKHVGPFLDELFIDWVDHEYCFRLRKFGYKVILANNVKLKHRLGITKTYLPLGLFKISWRSHNSARLYYKFRNSLFVLNLYKHQLPVTFKLFAYKELLCDLGKIFLLEKNKGEYIKLVAKALRDVSKGRLGKLTYP